MQVMIKMQKKRQMEAIKMKKLMAIMMVFCLTTALVGCTNKTTSTPEVPNTSSETTENESPEQVKKDLSGKVVYWAMWNETEPQAEAIMKAAELFEKDYPDCEIEIQWLGRSNSTIVGPALDGGEQIDLLDNFAYPQNPEMFLDITETLNEQAIGQPDKTVAETILPVLLVANEQGQAAAGLDTSKHYGIQMNPWVVGFFYNKDLFKQAGIETVPTTWNEFLETCQKLKTAGINPITVDDAYMTLIPNNYLARLVGPETIKLMSQSAGEEAWTSDAVKQSFEAMEELSEFMSPNVVTNKYPAGQQEFALSEAAMYLNASWMPGEVAETTGEDFPWGVFNFPVVEGGVEDASYISVGGIPMAVAAKSKNPEAASEFLKYIVAKEVQDYLSELGSAPCTIGSEWPGAVADAGSIVEQAKHVAGLAKDLAGEFVGSVFTIEMNKVITKQSTADQAIKTLNKEVANYK